jgi:metal-responsive CopG/Arc/MetJ family transcriptional regulator
MATTGKPVRQSVSLPARLAQRVRALARARRTSASRIVADLIASGLEAKELEKRRYLELLAQLRATESPAEQKRLTEELARLTFGE